MTIGAIVMMSISMLVLWGGLTAAIINIVRFKGPQAPEVRRDL